VPAPIVAIVGRTNVGKSVLFNRLVGRRLAVVEDVHGVTRDRLYAEVELDGRQIVLVDTGGLAGAESDRFITKVKEQAALALQEADLILLMVDGQEGLVSLDWDVAEVVRRTGKPVILIANKLESPNADATEFAELGLGMPLRLSALQGMGLGELIDEILAHLPEEEAEAEVVEGETAVALVGRPNVGKSAIINALLGEERVIVSDEPGTTRDAVDIAVEVMGEPYRLVDTAGLRRRGKRSQGLEYYSSLRALRALQRADVGIVVFDALEGVTQQDAHIVGEVIEAGRGLVLVANKWDLVQDYGHGEGNLDADEEADIEATLRRDFTRMLRDKLSFAYYAELLFTSAVTGEGLMEVLPSSKWAAEQYAREVNPVLVDQMLREALMAHQPAYRGGRRLKVYAIEQVATRPPTFVLSVSDPKRMHFSYKRYLVNQLREAFGFQGTPIRLLVRGRARQRRG